MYVDALPLNAIKEAKAAFKSDMEDDLEPAETRHFKKNQVYAQPQAAPIYAQAQPVAVYSQPQHVPVYSQQQPVAVYSQHQPAAVYSQPQPVAVYSQPQPVQVYSQQQPVASHTVYTASAPAQAHSGGGYGDSAGYGGQSYGHSWGGSYGVGNQYVFALYVNALPVNVVEKSDAALVSDLNDDLEVAETKHHYKKKQQVYVHPQPVYVGEYWMFVLVNDKLTLCFNLTAVLVPVKSGGGHGGGYSGGYGGQSSYNYGSYQQSSYGHKSKHG
ncbi:unnamed protein product [Diamesa tonsa]